MDLPLRVAVLIVFSALLLSSPVAADPAPFPLLEAEQQKYALYRQDSKTLSKTDRWEIRKHGLRHAPLDRRIWGVRYFDRLDNRNLVSIRPYVLRRSERADVRITEVELEFLFEPVNYQQMSLLPHSHTALFEIGFAGELQPGLPGRQLRVDRGYAARFSGHFQFHSGLLFRSHSKSIMVGPGAEKVLKPGRWYHVRLQLQPEQAEVLLNGTRFAVVKGRELDRGLVSLISGWHPLQLRKLAVRGSELQDGRRIPFEVSGLYRFEQ